jgi:hypothetical protein
MVFRDKKDRYRHDTKFELINHYLTFFEFNVGFRRCECSNVAGNTVCTDVFSMNTRLRLLQNSLKTMERVVAVW